MNRKNSSDDDYDDYDDNNKNNNRNSKKSNVIYDSKIIFMGDVDVGKTTCILALLGKGIFIRNVKTNPKIKTPRVSTFIDISTRDVNVTITTSRLASSSRFKHPEKTTVTHRLSFWDSCGMIRVNSLTSDFFRNTTHFIIVVDVTKPFDLKYIESMIKTVKMKTRHLNQRSIIIVGNKIDLTPDSNCINNVIKFAGMIRVRVIFCCAKKMVNTSELLKSIIEISEKMRKVSLSGNTISQQKNHNPTSFVNTSVVNNNNYSHSNPHYKINCIGFCKLKRD